MDSFETQLTNTINDDILSTPIAKYVEVYAPSKKEIKELEEKIVEKIKTVSEEFKNSPQTEKEKTKAITELADFVEKELPRDMIDNREEQAYQDDAKTELDIIREKLRTFSRAIPSFVMAAKDPKNLTIDNLQDAVSDEDFEMLFNERDKLHTPDRFTKADFIELRDGGDYEENGEIIHFDGFFEKYRFNAAIQEFEKKREQLADYLNNTTKEDIFSYIPAQKSNQIFTPREVVNKMLNILEAENPGIFSNPNLTFCDLHTKSGLFLTEIAKRLNHGLTNIIPDEQARLKHIFENQLFGFAPTQIVYDIAASYIYGGFPEISRQNLKKQDLTEQFKKGEPLNMKFDVVIGNPPYQEETKDTSDKPIYNYFMSEAYKFADKVCFITPARFLFNAGKTPKKWNAKMLNDKHLKVAYYEQDSSNVFPNTDIKGGVAITYRDAQKNFGKIGTFTHFEELNSALRKVLNSEKFCSIDEIYFGQEKFNLDVLYMKNPEAKNIVGSEGKEKRLTSSIFGQLEDVFSKNRKNETDFKILGVIKNRRKWRYINSEYIEEHPNLRKFKVMLPGSNGSGAIGEVLSTPLVGEPLVGEPLVGHTQTFISFGAFDNREEAENLLKYIKTKFARTMLGTLKITQSNKKDTWRNVPLQNFTNNSDIDWSQPIAQIDQQLYKKYGLSEKEIAFIEEKVREME